MSQEIRPLDMQEIGFVPNPDIDELRPTNTQKDTIECYVYSELHEQRKHYKVPKNDPNATKQYDKYANDPKLEYEGETFTEHMFVDKAKKPVVLLAHHKGSIKTVNEFITGVQITDGTHVIESKSLAAHPRTWIAAIPGAYGNPPTYVLDKQQVNQTIKDQDRFSDIIDVGEFSELVKRILKNETERKR